MNHSPEVGLPARIYVPIVAAIMILAAIPICGFLKTAFSAGGTTLGAGTAPPPVIARAIDALRTRIARNPRDTAAYRELAALEQQAGKTQAAADILARGRSVNPDAIDILVAHADIVAGMGDTTSALHDLDHAVEHAPNDASARFARATLYTRLERTADADRDYAVFEKVAPADDPRRAQLGGRSGAQ